MTKEDSNKLDSSNSAFSFQSFQISEKNEKSLGKAECLKRKVIINRLFTSGFSYYKHPIKAYFLITQLPSGFPAQVAFSVPKKNFPKSVDRSRLKRLMREAYRANKASFYSELVNQKKQVALMFVFSSKNSVDYNSVEKSISSLMEQILNHNN